jgi:hypothetical protein
MDIFGLFSLLGTEYRHPQYMWISGIRMWFQLEEVAKQSDGRGNAKESFAKMNKD